MLLVLVI